MQKIATKVFVWASIAFAIIGMIMVLTIDQNQGPSPIMLRFLFASVIIILTSFALSVASKYLNSKS
ncbi:MAG: hypothetical protein A3I32_02995 [Candidatus Yanofskybacteria bacterium RIFCSPLOWO2_02_FULL_45_10]|uniref:Uncharacterized protein n=2 Tax=Candidatus Yanofskyibacteriota TaxID=1752733 RepID=A0A1F8G4Y0_9BACT|nr:MAG: hypothetical protein A3F25_02370 [Candidatus Yanofskybacteria bacterium RIFCSPHIGHO2_12_FULL_45_19b]OGN31718.1 MAG: hypothetical protein A3I32_02995 [Candidatus Yanofskybacteria bacterium RIFCSPLOWO2_02_FULL_45_10]